jgi:prepilin-type N-terminal cleavage/methylation domain-containing protein
MKQRGFTLLEMLVVLGIIGATMVVVSMTMTTFFLNYQQPGTQQILLQQAQNAGYQMPRDIQMSSNVTLSSPDGFPVSINIPVDQDPNNNYQVSYFLYSDELKRRQYSSSGNLTSETTITRYVDTGNTTFQNISEGLYRLTIRLDKDGETATANYEAQRRLVVQ